ncbi:uncharacterized protein LOC108324538 [Vigna angularis]|nr:uncharacterized protein LOC108324538 [Vigna angularis]
MSFFSHFPLSQPCYTNRNPRRSSSSFFLKFFTQPSDFLLQRMQLVLVFLKFFSQPFQFFPTTSLILKLASSSSHHCLQVIIACGLRRQLRFMCVVVLSSVVMAIESSVPVVVASLVSIVAKSLVSVIVIVCHRITSSPAPTIFRAFMVFLYFEYSLQNFLYFDHSLKIFSIYEKYYLCVFDESPRGSIIQRDKVSLQQSYISMK